MSPSTRTVELEVPNKRDAELPPSQEPDSPDYTFHVRNAGNSKFSDPKA